jgi:adenosylcobinamide kinase/adenosylcobinamide-phosphate guanylyltransferase
MYITGGERSGKSSFAQKMALERSINPVYLATAKVLDNDFAKRVQRHQSDRDARWDNIEKPVFISQLDLDGRTVLLDCVTLWLTNIYYNNNADLQTSIDFAKAEWTRFIQKDINLIAVSNEIGMGVHGSTNEIRKFVELQGWMNQFIANQAHEAWLLVSGIPVKIKPSVDIK